jgi:hypothetical protein
MKSITLSNILLFVVFILAVISIILYAKVVLLSIKTPTINKTMVLNDNDNAKPSHSALIIISFLASLTIVINLINQLIISILFTLLFPYLINFKDLE